MQNSQPMSDEKSNFSNIDPIYFYIKQIKAELNKIDPIVIKPTPKEAIEIKETYKSELKKLYIAVKSNKQFIPDYEFHLVLADIITKYGHLRYGEEGRYDISMVLMRASLNIQLFALKMCPSLYFKLEDNLDELEKSLFQHDQFEELDHFILTSDMDAIAQKIQDIKLPSEDLYRLGFTLSWMANGLLGTENFKPKLRGDEDKVNKLVGHPNNNRLSQVCSLGAKILELDNTEKSRLELAELYYNGMRSIELHRLQIGIDEVNKWLDEAKILNPSLDFAARVEIAKCCDARKPEIAKIHLKNAVKITNSMQSPHWVANLNNLRADYYLKEGNLDMAEKFIDMALEYSTACRGKRDSNNRLINNTHDHKHFGFFDLKKAKIKHQKKEFNVALKHIDYALETLQHDKHCMQVAIELKNKVTEAKYKYFAPFIIVGCFAIAVTVSLIAKKLWNLSVRYMD